MIDNEDGVRFFGVSDSMGIEYGGEKNEEGKYVLG